MNPAAPRSTVGAFDALRRHWQRNFTERTRRPSSARSCGALS